MSGFGLQSRGTQHKGAGRGARIARLGRAGFRLASAGAVALAVAGCSQETARFDYGARSAPAAKQDTRVLGEETLRSWRYSARGDLSRRAGKGKAEARVTGGLPPEEPSDTRARTAAQDTPAQRAQLAPMRDRHEVHVVRQGDTLFSISRRYGVAVRALTQANRLSDPGLIRIGDELVIPHAGNVRHAWRDERGRETRTDAYAPPPRRTDRERHRHREPARHAARDELYLDPLLGERAPRRERVEAEPPRRSVRRDDAAHRPRDPLARRAGPPPPAPMQRPDSPRPSQIARADPPKRAPASTPVAAAAPEKARSAPMVAADCRDLMKNPPPRSGANFRRPAHGLIISRFGEKSDGLRNDGINISVPHGTPVKAAENGVVVYAGDELSGLGKLVLVRHADGWVSAYGHNSELLVSRCDTVSRGQEIARAGVSGNVSKPQIHFELRKNARPVDPEQHIAGTS